jgi:hypothetical protein
MQELMPPGNTELKSPVHPEKNVTIRPSQDLQNTGAEGGRDIDWGVTKVNTREMLNEDTRNLERKGETCRVRRRRWVEGGLQRAGS